MPLMRGAVNTGQASFEAMAHVVRRVQGLQDARCDQHNRNSLLTQCIQYTCSLPHPDPSKTGRWRAYRPR